ncbi:ATP-binding protein [Dermabacteraceae bacterium P13136]
MATTPQAAPARTPDHPHPGQWRLTHLQVSNWGTFDGTHNVAISPKGYFLTGGPGTGKSTLLDAISALLTPPRSLHFNAAASDAGPARTKYRRTLASYIRGAWATQRNPETGEFVQEVLRDKTTLSMISLRYADGGGRVLQLSRVMLLHKGHTTDSDVKNLYIISTRPLDVSDVRPFVGAQIGAKALEKELDGCETFRQFREYRAKFSQILGIPDEKALSLLHKIQSAKELGDINALLRDYMLDEPRTFDLADQALANFQSLSEVHSALVTAREQRDCLRKLRDDHVKWSEHGKRFRYLSERRSEIDLFASRHLAQLLEDELDRLLAETDRVVAQKNRLTKEADDARLDVAQLKERRKQAGGGQIDEWKTQIARFESERDRRKERASEYSALLATVELRVPSSEEMFLASQRDAKQLQESLAAADTQARAAAFEAEVKVRQLAEEMQRVKEELDSLTSRASNLPREDISLRDALAEKLGVPPQHLPFAAELLQVRAGQEEWTAAAEQALRSLGRSILVPDAHYARFTAVLNETRLRRRVVYNRIRTDLRLPERSLQPGTLAEKIEIKPGQFEPWLRHEIASRMDYVCAETLEQFQRENRAVLRSGQIKHSATRHEKNAEHLISDRSRWILGFDNRAKRRVYEDERARVEKTLFEAQAHRKDLVADAARLREKQFAVEKILAVGWDDIDAASVARRIANLADLVRSAEDGSVTIAQIGYQIEAVEKSLRESEEELLEVIKQQGALEERAARARERLAEARSLSESRELEPAVERDLAERFNAIAPTLLLGNIEQVTKDAAANLDAEIAVLTRNGRALEEDMRTTMREFSQRWPSVTGDTEVSLEAAGEYLAILAQIEEEKLPDVEERFFTFFTGNTLSDVQALATAISREPAQIRQRLQRINSLLAQVEFHQGRYLQLSMRPVHLDILDTFKRALHAAVGDVVENDITRDREKAEERFLSLQQVMGMIADARNEEDQTSRIILDVRRHVHFHAEEVDPDGNVVHAHESGGPLSGGQNERLATFCLAAALRYQLAGTGTQVPQYAPIIIDEAFSKGAGKFITAAMQSFEHFGFQVMLANPGKNPQAVAPFIGGVGVVSIRDDRYSSVSPIEFVPVTE